MGDNSAATFAELRARSNEFFRKNPGAKVVAGVVSDIALARCRPRPTWSVSSRVVGRGWLGWLEGRGQWCMNRYHGTPWC